jgi:hypothetical protein
MGMGSPNMDNVKFEKLQIFTWGQQIANVYACDWSAQ